MLHPCCFTSSDDYAPRCALVGGRTHHAVHACSMRIYPLRSVPLPMFTPSLACLLHACSLRQTLLAVGYAGGGGLGDGEAAPEIDAAPVHDLGCGHLRSRHRRVRESRQVEPWRRRRHGRGGGGGGSERGDRGWRVLELIARIKRGVLRIRCVLTPEAWKAANRPAFSMIRAFLCGVC